MRASSIMLFAVATAAVGNWAHGKSPTPKAVIEAVFAILVVGFLDQGQTEPVAKGFAWIFLAAVLLGNNSPLQAIAKVTGTSTKAPATATHPKVV